MKKDGRFSREGYLKENYHYFHLRDTAGQERDFHFHEFDKLVLLISGNVDYAVEADVYRLKPWDVLLVKHHTIHKALIDKSEPYERIILYIDSRYFERFVPGVSLMECFEASDIPGRHLLTPDAEQRARLETALRRYELAAADGGFGADAMRDTLIAQFLILVNRMAAAAPETAEPRYDGKIERALSYINEHLTEELTVDSLAETVFLSRYHFMRLFKSQTGATVHAYIRQKRLLYAARLIREGVPAGRAALQCGFADYSAFHRAFKSAFGVAPSGLKG